MVQVMAPYHRVAAPDASQVIGSSRTSTVVFLRPDPKYPFSAAAAKNLGFNNNLNTDTMTFGGWVS